MQLTLNLYKNKIFQMSKLMEISNQLKECHIFFSNVANAHQFAASINTRSYWHQ